MSREMNSMQSVKKLLYIKLEYKEVQEMYRLSLHLKNIYSLHCETQVHKVAIVVLDFVLLLAMMVV